jgi:acetate kinase
MKILVLNSGSSSIKYRLFDMSAERELAAGAVDRIGESDISDHESGLRLVAQKLRESGTIADASDLDAIGHRVVHGGDRFKAPALINDEVLDAIRAVSPLAPLHNPHNLLGIEVALRVAPRVPQVAVFDTAFHQSMPPHAYRYALPEALYAEHHVRRYGFHGTSHAYVAKRAARRLGKPLDALNLITLHLGNGASAAAISNGHCVDTSMGMTPLEGLVMGTRCGDLDPALAFYIGRVTGLDSAAVEGLLNKESGLKGLCGANDMREVLRRMGEGDPQAQLAFDVYCYRIKKYLGAYIAALGRVDAIVFTAGIGENAPAVRARVCNDLEIFGIHIDARRNAAVIGETAEIQSGDSAVRMLVIRTNEELEIATQTRALLPKQGAMSQTTPRQRETP